MTITAAATVSIVDGHFETEVTLTFADAVGLWRVKLPVTSGWDAPVISNDGAKVGSAVYWYVGDVPEGEGTSGDLTATLTQ